MYMYYYSTSPAKIDFHFFSTQNAIQCHTFEYFTFYIQFSKMF